MNARHIPNAVSARHHVQRQPRPPHNTWIETCTAQGSRREKHTTAQMEAVQQQLETRTTEKLLLEQQVRTIQGLFAEERYVGGQRHTPCRHNTSVPSERRWPHTTSATLYQRQSPKATHDFVVVRLLGDSLWLLGACI
jgi:hypothetical protein